MPFAFQPKMVLMALLLFAFLPAKGSCNEKCTGSQVASYLKQSFSNDRPNLYGVSYPSRPLSREQELERSLKQIHFTDIESSISRSILNPDEIEVLKRHSGGVLSAKDYLKISPEQIRGGYSLGLSNHHDHYKVLSRLKNLKEWRDAYNEFGIKYTEANHTEKFLRQITSSFKKVVMFVPNKDAKFKDGITRSELDWLLSHPDQIENTLFVFGGYDFFDDRSSELFMELGYSGIERVQMKIDALLKAIGK
jgi:hypothetical protein